ncbi:MAG: ABC transporter ATP-binding protein [Gaiellaceae bacterium]
MSGLVCRDVVASPGGHTVLRRASLSVPRGQRAVLVGPSGAGKTTLLRTIAGLEALAEGSISLDGNQIDRLPANQRGTAVVFQEPRLLPHLGLVENVAFGLRLAGVRKKRRSERARQLLSEVGLAGLGDRDIRGLSGGEQHRVALARALCVEPDVLLLDEPLASVDPNRRESLRALIVALQETRQLTTLFVTHDRAEAAELGQTVAVMLEGTVVQQDEPEVLFERPQSPAVARFFGSANLLRGVVERGELTIGNAAVEVHGPDGPATFTIRPERVVIDSSARLRLTVTDSTYLGTTVRLQLEGEGLSLEARVVPGHAPAAGESVGVELPTSALWRIPSDEPQPSGARAAL